MNIALWVVQGLLALAFIYAGYEKAFPSLEAVKKKFESANHIPARLVRFIGISELLGGIGLILPGITHIVPPLTIAAALGLVLVMLFAGIFHMSRREYAHIGITVVIMLLAAFIVVGRLAWMPL